MTFEEFKKNYEKIRVVEFPAKVNIAPIVSVCVVAYQHGDFIKECLDGILMQETNFDFEILLGDDASTDGTREICIDYAKRFPNKIRLFLHHRENNITIGGNPTGRFNFVYNLYAARGKYIALCEGDDYWTDPLKLQKQVDFMQEHEDCGVCFHNASIVNGTELTDRLIYEKSIPKRIGFCEYINTSIYAKTCTVLIKVDQAVRSYIEKTPIKYLGDSTLMPLCLLNDKFCYYLEDNMAIYRKHEGGVWSLKKEKDILFEVQQLQKYRMHQYEASCSFDTTRINFLNSTSKLAIYNLLNFQLLQSLIYFKEYVTNGGSLLSKHNLLNFFRIIKIGFK